MDLDWVDRFSAGFGRGTLALVPYFHDASDLPGAVPQPSTLLFLGVGLLLLSGIGWIRLRRKR
jgi:LPXTG-motif cell wall-anchored protein